MSHSGGKHVGTRPGTPGAADSPVFRAVLPIPMASKRSIGIICETVIRVGWQQAQTVSVR